MEKEYYGNVLNNVCKFYNFDYSIRTNKHILSITFKNSNLSFIYEFDLTVFTFIECVDNSLLGFLNFLNFKL